MLKIGTPVVYCQTKFSLHPGPRAKQISPSRHGDAYSYCVEKLWLVEELVGKNKIVIVTRRGKRREIDADDPNLRPASILDRLKYWGRFPKLEQADKE